VIDHRVAVRDSFRLTENTAERAMADHLLGDRNVTMNKVGELPSVA
jgi:acyl-CoA dehydrogenase